MTTLCRASWKRGQRRGIAAVEVALCLPAILVLFLGALECADMLFLRQTVAVSAYEGVRRAIQFGATSDDVVARTSTVLAMRDVDDATITLDPTDVGSATKGTRLSVTVSVPCATSASPVLPLKFFDGRTLTYTATMVKE